MFLQSIIQASKVRTAVMFLAFFQTGFSQQAGLHDSSYRLSIEDAINLSKSNNKWIKIARKEEMAVEEEKKDAVNALLPQVNLGVGYQRYSALTLYTDGLGGAESGKRKPSPNGASLGFESSFNIYSGGRSKALIKDAEIREELADLYTREQAGNVGLQTVFQYLNFVRLNDLRRFLNDQLTRAETRLKNINSFFINQKVTRSDVLRAEVTLSNVKLNIEQVENDISITKQKLNVLLDLPENAVISATDSAGMLKPELPVLGDILQSFPATSYSLQRAKLNIAIQSIRLRTIKSNNKPSIFFTSAYNFNYPNYLFYPPVDQLYSIGFVGVKIQYSISSLYHNKHKSAAAFLRLEELKDQRIAISDNVKQEITSYYIKYGEALNRIEVNKNSIGQAAANYKITNTKYLNQLALLTDLLDADNLYQESRFNLVKAQTEAQLIYYQLQYLLGSL